MARKSAITVKARSEGLKNRNAALARRLALGQVHGGGSPTLPLKEPKRWHTYIANSDVNANEFYLMKERGWVPLDPSDLGCPVEQTGFRLSPDGNLVRGVRGEEMVFKMEEADYQILMDAKTQANMRGIGSASKTKTDMAEAASGALGSEAADYIHNLDGQVIDRITGGDQA